MPDPGGDRWTRVGAPDGPILEGRRPLAGLVERLRGEGRLRDVIGEVAGLEIAGLSDDSRIVEPGALFVAVRGLRVDGHRFVAEAVGRGVVAVAVERPIPGLAVPQLVVEGGAASLAAAAGWWYGDPSRGLATVGVTGTNGKTTTTFLAAAALDAVGLPSGLVGTIGIRVGGALQRNEEPQTTPGAPTLQRLLRGMVLAGDRAAVIETSSHGLAAERVGSVAYGAAIFTNLSHEHLDFHGTFEAYRAAKLRLFSRLPATAADGRPGLGVVNLDDQHGSSFAEAASATGARVVTYGTGSGVDVRLASLDAAASGTRLEMLVDGVPRTLELALPGRYNAINALGVLGLALGWGLDLGVVTGALEAVRGVPGRMERVERGQPYLVVIDFAHTPRAIDAVLAELAPLAAPGRGLISVFGASGERDVGKRPLMGEAAARRSRLVIVTEDDSRGEDPAEIHESIASGAESAGARRGESLLVIADRREAIAEAFRHAEPGDVVALLGKGHETWNIGPRGPEPWSDRGAAEELLEGLRARPR
jgi:UDP-N-acetylmuramoyl-L-alanyl-D-glutamate--2,6-diaminopimelate ligase